MVIVLIIIFFDFIRKEKLVFRYLYEFYPALMEFLLFSTFTPPFIIFNELFQVAFQADKDLFMFPYPKNELLITTVIYISLIQVAFAGVPFFPILSLLTLLF
jgi:hypothetical protein